MASSSSRLSGFSAKVQVSGYRSFILAMFGAYWRIHSLGMERELPSL